MGTSSKLKKPWGKRSMKNIKQWCKARGIHPADHMARFPMLAGYYDIPAKAIIAQLSWFKKIRGMICQLLNRIKK